MQGHLDPFQLSGSNKKETNIMAYKSGKAIEKSERKA